ncbi:MAG: protein translocase subunit SecF [Clostridia bacterium]|nr:protein translocase subunit SecF [Clostridia bacterium]
MKQIKFTANRWKFVLLPAAIIVLGIVFLIIRGGFNYDIEFMGGIRMQVDLGTAYDNDELVKLIEDSNGVKVTVQKGSVDTQVIVKTPPVEENVKNEIFNTLKEKYSLEDSALMSTSSASASFGTEVQRKAFIYTLLAILCILVYIAFRFEWRSAIMAVIGLAINVFVMYSVYSITNIAMNTTFIAAMLTVIGYSINNTIVIFDRIRENMKQFGGKKGSSITDIVDNSIKESLGRTINSTITTLITIVLLYIIGVSAIREFALPLIVGIIIGAYTSIFIAGPFWAVWKQSERDAKAAAARAKKSK